MNDDVLIRYLDGEADARERAAVEALPEDSAPARRLWALREASNGFAATVAHVGAPALPPLSRPRRRIPLQAAAVALLVLAGSAAAVPVTRNALLDAAGSAVAWVRGADSAPDAGAAPDHTEPASVILTDVGDVLDVEVDGWQAGGTLTLEPSGGAEVVARADQAELVVLPGRLRVRNTAGQDGDIHISVPPSVREVRVRVAGVAVEPVGPEGATRRVEMRGGA